MPDDMDHIQETSEFYNRLALDKARSRPIAVGAPGECKDCGEHSLRLVGGLCAPCRDDMKRGLSL